MVEKLTGFVNKKGIIDLNNRRFIHYLGVSRMIFYLWNELDNYSVDKTIIDGPLYARKKEKNRTFICIILTYS